MKEHVESNEIAYDCTCFVSASELIEGSEALLEVTAMDSEGKDDRNGCSEGKEGNG